VADTGPPSAAGPPVGIPEDVAAAATHGSFCPKLSSFACPVTAATGRDDAQPWSFHRTVGDLATGRRLPDAHAAGHLEACSGCLACRVPCIFDQDVPSQVRAGRVAVAAAGAPVRGHDDAVAAVAAGASPHGVALPAGRGTAADADVTVVPGCRDDEAGLEPLLRLLAAAGLEAAVVTPAGCCGGVLDDLGARDAAAAATAALGGQLAATGPVVATDPHCLPPLRAAVPADTDVRDVTSALAAMVDEGLLGFAGDPVRVAYHDPCLLARAEGATAPPRELLRAAGAEVVEPEGSGERTVCSGAGMGLELVAPGAAGATAARRAAQLDDTGVPAVTACAGARRRLATAGADVSDLVAFLADRLPPEPAP
jgi:Fe-S oxidoreductase